MNWALKSRSEWKTSCNRAYQNQNIRVTLSINKKKKARRADFSDELGTLSYVTNIVDIKDKWYAAVGMFSS